MSHDFTAMTSHNYMHNIMCICYVRNLLSVHDYTYTIISVTLSIP